MWIDGKGDNAEADWADRRTTCCGAALRHWDDSGSTCSECGEECGPEDVSPQILPPPPSPPPTPEQLQARADFLAGKPVPHGLRREAAGDPEPVMYYSERSGSPWYDRRDT